MPFGESQKTYTEQVNIRLRSEQKQSLEKKAEATGKTFSEWARETLLWAVSVPPDYRMLLAEFMAMRKLVLELHLHMIQNNEPPADETVRALAHEAEVSKFQAADRRIMTYLQE